MAINLSKNLIQKQSLKLTPSLKKSIDLLQLSRFELIKKIEKEINENPFLEKEDFSQNDKDSYGSDFDFDIESKVSLRDSLLKQLNEIHISKKDTKIAKVIIDSMDESGQLVEDIEDICSIMRFAFSQGEIERVLRNTIQTLSPIGIGYRDHKECIQIQINHKNIPKKIKNICNQILFNEKLDDIDVIKESLINDGISEEEFDKSLIEIKKCDLSPGLNFEDTKFIYPDLKIYKKSSDYRVRFIDDTFPIINLDDGLISEVKKEIKSSKNNKIQEKINDAKWLISSVKKRNETIQKVGEYICSIQIAFFEENPLKIQTLSNKDIAEKIGVHPSTVSRILRHKYIETPKGVMSLRALLVSSVSKTRNISAIQLMKLIEDIVNLEKKPKSDKKIAIELNKKGFNLARRTIAKYRKKNNIPSSRER